ncbi:MAG: L-2-amino-thiazoline-4-carboxylic acid hydrolase [Methanobacterium sp.]|uniref:L-2-amino-thiazoline-4-carboxylic acid hydrolase n=1 Tax=Methanobacterium sp. TaxID=2164 RepID=UPI003D64E429|nr:L-2-amino-thiazoline-4-carboxylic acid hydrolase [Methanobacterium sp.]
MSFRLKIASLWLPEYILKKELDKVARVTIEGFNDVLKQHAPERIGEIATKDKNLEGPIEERRAAMAMAHNNRVKLLIDVLGYENAIKIGREAMFKVGCKLGQEARQRLGVGNSFKDLELAAKILYKILGIDFKIENSDGKLFMKVNRCYLSKYYSSESCMVLSAADEGVVHGLNENMSMIFKERITAGAQECIACIYGNNGVKS